MPGCTEPEYQHHMCRKHFEFYSENPTTARFIAEVQALEDGTARWKLKGKVILQNIVHYTLNYPMPLIEHFPLEHVFLGELMALRHQKAIDSERIQQVIKDFDISENENLSDLQRVMNIRDVETSELGPKERYLFQKKDLPSKWPVILSTFGVALLFCFFVWMADASFQIRGVDLHQAEQVFWEFIPFQCALTVFVFLGLLIPSQYNFFIERSYNLTLCNDVKDNADVVNQAKFVKERRLRSGSYYATILGSVLGLSLFLFWALLGHGSPVTYQTIFLSLAVVLVVTPLVYAYNEMALFYPLVEAVKRKRVAIDLYNADHRGGLKKYHWFLYLTFLYNEGLAVVLMAVFALLPISKWWIILMILMLLPRLNHAGWALIGWGRSIVDYNREMAAEKTRLTSMEGSAENMNKMVLLKKTYPIGIIPIILFLVGTFLIPYVVNQLPEWRELLRLIER